MQAISQKRHLCYSELLKIIQKLQGLHPYGLFSFNLQDKIKIALEMDGKYNDNYKVLIQNLNSVLSHGLPFLKNRFGFSDDKLQEITSYINRICFSFESCADDEYLYKIPDIIVNCKTHGEYISSINDNVIPQLSINRDLYEKSMKKCSSQNDKKYIKKQISSAEILIKSINYRNSTLLKVAKEIIYRQYDFLSGNSGCMIPISIKSVANSLQFHESTIHRTIANKTIETPVGMFPLKTLMPKEIKSSIGHEFVSDYSIKEYIKNLINNEPKNNPYSDNHIVYFLDSRGINLSRRTIAKYRNNLDIPNVTQRLRLYRLNMS